MKEAETFCQSKVKQSIANLNQHIISAFSVQEEQVERQNIQSRVKKNSIN